MSEQKKSRKPLIVGIIAAVVILAVLLVLLLTQCTGGQDATESTPVQTTSGDEIPTYSLYWNLDKAEYSGKSEAGMSSRQPESDGYFHVRFFLDGEIVELKVADRKTINAIDVNDLMDLVFDEDGIVVGIIPVDDVPCEQVGWKFYVQSAAKTVIKLNSSASFNGLEVLLDVEADTGIYDMTGVEGEVGKSIIPISGDHVIAIADLSGKLTHVFVFERPTYMKSFKAECQHCKESVEWKMWEKTDTLPLEAGHYQLQNDIQLKTQMSMKEDATICLDLNGYAVDGASNARMYSLHNVGCELAIMDTSEAQTGVLRGHGEYNGQGGIVWARYGAFYLYGGTLDASDLALTNYGAAVNVPKERFFYMYGGTIIGGTAKCRYDAETGKYSYGLCGGVYVQGKFVMYDGVIKNGYAQGAVTERNADGTAKSFYGGRGGNMLVASGGEFEMHGGTIQNGKATFGGGNICVDSTGNVLLEGGVISGGRALEYGRNGGNVYINGSKATMTINGGSIINGVAQNCAGNLYTGGTVTMNGGYIGGGQCMDWNTGKVDATDVTTNVYNVNGKFIMYGGTVAGGFSNIDTAKNTTQTTLVLGGGAKISGDGKYQFPDLTLSVGGDNVKVTVAKLGNGAKIGVNTSMGIFTTPTSEDNLDNFYSNMEGTGVCYYNGCLALGRTGCVCGLDVGGKHIGDCDGTTLFWAPVKGTSVPTATGNYYLVADMKLKSQVAMAENATIHLDLNGYTLNGPDNHRTFSLHNPGTYLTITDSSAAKTGAIKSHGASTTQGSCVWTRYGAAVLYQGTLDASDYQLYQDWNAAGKDGIWGTADDSTSGRNGAAVDLGGSTTFTMYGGTIIGGTTVRKTQTKTVTEGEGEEATSYEATFTTAAGCGGAVSAATAKAVFNMYGGTIKNGVSQASGGNLYIASSATVNLYGGTVEGGFAGLYDEDGKTVVVKGTGGSIYLSGASATLNILGNGVLITGGKSIGNGGNLYLVSGTLNMKAGTITKGESLTDQGGNLFNSGESNLYGGYITDGVAMNGGNIGINSAKNTLLQGVTVSNGVVPGNGGNIRSSSTNTKGTVTIAEGTLITGGKARNGGNISIEANNYNKNDPVVTCKITGGTIEKGESTGVYSAKDKKYVDGNGGNIYLKGGSTEGTGTVTLTISGGLITEGKTMQTNGNGGNIRLDTLYTTLNMSGGTVSNGQAGDKDDTAITGWAGNIDVNAGTLNMSGGTVSGGWARNNGGSIRVNSGSAVANITGGTVYGGQNLDQGGNIWVGGGGVLNVDGTVTDGKYSVEIYNGTCAGNKNGGNIHANANANITLNGVKIYGGKAGTNADKNSANVNIMNPSVVNIGTVDIAGRFNIGGTESTITMYGKPVIQSGSSSVVSLQLNGNVMDISELDAGEDTAKVGIWDSGKFAAPAAAAQLAYFYSDSSTSMYYDEAALWVGTAPVKYCLCGLTSTDPDATHAHEDTSATNGCDGTILKWQSWTSTTSLPTTTGNYYLTGTVEINSPADYTTPDQVVNIDLNGHTVRNKTTGQLVRLIRFNGGTGVSLTITDTSAEKTGKMVTDACYDQGSLIWLNANDVHVTLIAGTLDASELTLRMNKDNPTVPNNDHGANAISVANSGAAFVMYGGTLIGGRAPYGGDAIAATNKNSTVAIHGGEIKTHENSTTNVTVRSFGTVTIDGTASVEGIVEMNAKDGKGNLTLAGSPAIEEIYLSKTSNNTTAPAEDPVLPVINITGELGNTTPIKVSTMSDTDYITDETVEANLDNFASTSAHLGIVWDDEADKLKLVDGVRCCLCGDQDGHADTSATTGCDGTLLDWTAWTSTTTLPTTAGNYYLTSDVVLDSPADYKTADQIVNLDLNGHTVRNKTTGQLLRLIRFNGGTGTSLTITDTSAKKTGKLMTDACYDQGSLIWMNANNVRVTLINGTLDASELTLRMNADDPTAPNNAHGANAISVANAGTVFTMYNGTIIGGRTPYGGDAIAATSSTSTVAIHGGSILTHENSTTGVSIRAFGAITIDGTASVEGIVDINNVNSTANLTLAGSPAIEGIHLSKTANSTLTPAEGDLPVINITGELGNTTPIKVTTMGDMPGYITAETVEANFAKFASGSLQTAIEWDADANKIKMVEIGTNHTEHDSTWNVITNDTTALTTGRWYLTGDCTASVTSTTGSVIICLNGHSWSGNAPLAVTEGVVRICDCSSEGTGSITNVTVAAGATLVLEGTEAASVVAAEGASVSILGSSVTSVEGSSVTVEDGQITTLTADSVTLSGAPQIGTMDADALTVGTMSSSASVGINADAAGVLVTGTVPYSYKNIFTCANYQVAVTENGLELLAKDAHVHCKCAGTLTNGQKFADGTVHNCLDIVYTAVSASDLTGGSNRTVTANWYLESSVTVTGGNYQFKDSTVNLCLNGQNWNGMDSKRAFSFQDGTNYMSITTCQADVLDADLNPTNNRVVATGTTAQGGCVWVRYGTLDFYAGYLDGSDLINTSHGGTTCIDTNSVMNMYGGTILGAYATANVSGTKQNAGSCYINGGGILNLYNGTIKGGRSNNQGGNLVVGGTLNMHGGLITGGMINGSLDHTSANIATNNANARINMTGGEITGRISALVKGAVFAVSGDAKISETATSYRLQIVDSGDGTPMMSLVVGDLSDNASIYITNNQKNGVNFVGVYATAADGYTITAQDLDKVDNCWYYGGTSSLYKIQLSADGKTISFVEK